jgi:hypothetical protein
MLFRVYGEDERDLRASTRSNKIKAISKILAEYPIGVRSPNRIQRKMVSAAYPIRVHRTAFR